MYNYINPLKEWDYLVYRCFRLIVMFLCTILFRLEVTGRENIPKEGGLIIISNHASLLDPLLVGAAITRPVAYMAKEELFRIPILRWLLRKLNVFPVNRKKVGTSTIKHGMEVLRDRKVLALFPEGTRSQDGSLLQAHFGAAMYTRKTGVPVLPVGIIGSAKAMKPGSKLIRPVKIKIRIGKPLIFNDGKGDVKVEKAELEKITEVLMNEIAQLVQ
jgi:1-acyl-sn-glycerol-3-phosphate acyltransferase